MKSISIMGQDIGEDEPCYFMAEVGGNYGSIEDVNRIVEACLEIGIDAIKFQTFEAETITTKDNVLDLEVTGKVSQHELFKKYEPKKELQKELMRYAKERGVSAFSAPSHLQDLDFLEQLEVPAYKIGSDLMCHIPLLREVAMTNKPIILSTGMATMEEIRLSVEEVLKINSQLALLHCVSDYPVHDENVNLRSMLVLKEEFNLPVGFSDHTKGPEISIAAVARGAKVIERHFWVEGNQKGPDLALCSDKEEYGYLIKTARRIEKAIGTENKTLSPSETINRVANRVGIVALQDIKPDQIITVEIVDIRRPGSGIAPKDWDAVIGSRVKHSIHAGRPILWDDLENV